MISHDADRKLLEKVGETTLKNIGNFGLKPEDMIGTGIVYPTLTFSERMTIDLGVETVELIRVAPSHTKVASLSFCLRKSSFFSGDILFTDFHPFMADGESLSLLQQTACCQT